MTGRRPLPPHLACQRPGPLTCCLPVIVVVFTISSCLQYPSSLPPLALVSLAIFGVAPCAELVNSDILLWTGIVFLQSISISLGVSRRNILFTTSRRGWSVTESGTQQLWLALLTQAQREGRILIAALIPSLSLLCKGERVGGLWRVCESLNVTCSKYRIVQTLDVTFTQFQGQLHH